MRLLLSQIAEKNTTRSIRQDTLTRKLINEHLAQANLYRKLKSEDPAIEKRLQTTAQAIRALCPNVLFENEYKELSEDLINHPEFQEATKDGHVTYGMIKPHVNVAKKENLHRTDDEIADAITSAISSPLQPTIVRHTYMPNHVAHAFYDNLRGKRGNDDIFNRVAQFMSSGAITGLVLINHDGNAIQEWRNQIGATNPTEAAEGTVRKTFADSIENNVVHGSDSPQNAEREIKIFASLL